MKGFVKYAHEQGLAVAQKNVAELGTAGKEEIGFDFAITEDCQALGECGSYAEAFGDHFFQIEYTDEGSASPAPTAADGSRSSAATGTWCRTGTRTTSTRSARPPSD